MPKMGVSKESLEGKPPVGAGIFTVRLDGFKPKTSKKGDSTNLNPILKVINHATLNDRNIFFSCNTNAGWIMEAFSHCFGLPLEERPDGGKDLPGEFVPDPNSPTDVAKMRYNGPLLGLTGQLELVLGKDDKGKDQDKIKQFMCKVPGCTIQHPAEMS